MGARYLSEMKFKYNNADVQFTQQLTNLVLAGSNPFQLPAGTPIDALLTPQFSPGAPLSAGQHVNTEIDHPAQLQARHWLHRLHEHDDHGRLRVDRLQLVRLARRQLRGASGQCGLSHTLIEDYKSSSSIRFGVEHAFAAGFRGRVGFDWIGSPAPDVTVTPLLPDMDRRNYTIGIGLPLGASYTLDAAYPARRHERPARATRLAHEGSPPQPQLQTS